MKSILLPALLFTGLTAIAQCDPIEVPYFEGFESSVAPLLPECYETSYLTFGSSEVWETSPGPVTGFTNKAAQLSTEGNVAAGANLSTMLVYLEAGTEYNVSYRLGRSQDTEVTVNVSMKLPGSVNINLAQITLSSVTPEVYSHTFSVPETAGYSLEVNASSEANRGLIYLDDIAIQENIMALEDNAFAGFNYYPNPVKDILTLSSNTALDTAEVYSVTGQLVLQHPLDKNSQLNLTSLPAGVYMMNVTSDKAVKRVKLIKD